MSRNLSPVLSQQVVVERASQALARRKRILRRLRVAMEVVGVTLLVLIGWMLIVMAFAIGGPH